MSEDVVRIIVLAVVSGATAAVVVSWRLRAGRKRLRGELAQRGLEVQPGAGALDVPPTTMVPGRGQGARWSARVPGEPPLTVYAGRRGLLFAAWRSSAPDDVQLVVYQKPSAGSWFHRHLRELRGEDRPEALPAAFEAYADPAERAAAVLADGRLGAALGELVASSRVKGWCLQLDRGAGYLLSYDETRGAPKLDAVIAGARAIEAALAAP